MLGPSRPSFQIEQYQQWLAQSRGLQFADYDALWRWSVEDLPAFWQSIWDYNAMQSPAPHSAVLADARMPGTKWFVGAQVNYAQQVLRHVQAGQVSRRPAIVFRSERGVAQEIGWDALQDRVGALAASLKDMGIGPGDRVAAYLPNIPETVIAFLACASIGAIWSVCAPDMGPLAVLDRFVQIGPKVLIACDGTVYGGKTLDRRAMLTEMLTALPSVQHLVLLPYLDGTIVEPQTSVPVTLWQDALCGAARCAPAWLPFDAPLWIVYSSGTTGLPKPIVHGHGGVMLEALKLNALHMDMRPDDRFHWVSSTGWIMWNCQVAALLSGVTICLYDGSPAHSNGQTDWSTLWRFVGETGVTIFGAGAAMYASWLKAGVAPNRAADLSALRALGSTGSPLSEECYQWVYDSFAGVPRPGQPPDQPIWLSVISGGTDFAGAFLVGNPALPVVRGQMQCRALGASVFAWDDAGKELVDAVGELVCTKPIPSMPLYFWNDPDGKRYFDSYFDTYPGVWRHGDWLRVTPEGGAIIYGRSDATINRHGVRMGTAELYRAVEALPEVLDSMVVDLEFLGRESWMPLFVVLREGLNLDAALTERLNHAIRTAMSPRHVPSEILQVAQIPRTLSGKKQELPIKKLLLGQPPEKVLNRDAMANPDSLDWFIAYAAARESQ